MRKKSDDCNTSRIEGVDVGVRWWPRIRLSCLALNIHMYCHNHKDDHRIGVGSARRYAGMG